MVSRAVRSRISLSSLARDPVATAMLLGRANPELVEFRAPRGAYLVTAPAIAAIVLERSDLFRDRTAVIRWGRLRPKRFLSLQISAETEPVDTLLERAAAHAIAATDKLLERGRDEPLELADEASRLARSAVFETLLDGAPRPLRAAARKQTEPGYRLDSWLPAYAIARLEASGASREAANALPELLRATTVALGRALRSAFYFLVRSPLRQEQLYAEASCVLRGVRPRGDVVERLPSIAAFVAECLRLHPPVRFHCREAVASTALSQIHVPRGSQLWLPTWHLHRHASSWSDPDLFRPERFLRSPAPGSYLPLGPQDGGFGGAIVRTTTVAVITRLLQRSRWRAPRRPRFSTTEGFADMVATCLTRAQNGSRDNPRDQLE